jgi:hypothetical protein
MVSMLSITVFGVLSSPFTGPIYGESVSVRILSMGKADANFLNEEF